MVAPPGGHDGGGDEEGRHQPGSTGDGSPDRGSGCLGAEQDHQVDRQAAGAYPLGQEQLQGGVDVRQEGYPGNTSREQHQDGERGGA